MKGFIITIALVLVCIGVQLGLRAALTIAQHNEEMQYIEEYVLDHTGETR